MMYRSFGPTLAVVLGLMQPALQAQTPSEFNADQGWSEVSRCAARGSERERHACLDDVLRRAGLLTPQAEASERRRQFGLESEPERLEVKVLKAANGTDGKLVITTADGAVWKQTDSDTPPRLPRAGDTVRIRSASLRSYLCELPSHHTFRCVRTK